MHCGSDGAATAKYLHLMNREVWDQIEPAKNLCQSGVPLRIKKQKEEKPKKKKEKDNAKHEKGIEIKNKQFSFTSFLIPICVTGEKKDYQLLYCICALRNALTILSTTLRKDGFAQLYMVGMKSAVDWEKIKANRITFSDVIIEFLIKSGSVCMVAANKREVFTKVNDPNAPFVVIVTSTDIQLPCQGNLCVGTSWLVFRRTERSRNVLFDREVFHSGRRAVHAGILVNGCSTILTVAFKRVSGLTYFLFDNRYGDFLRMEDSCYLRHSGNAISLNEGLFHKFKKDVQEWLIEKKKSERGYYSRYTGGWLTDGYKILRSGGLLLSPEDNESNQGRIKFLYKALPLAYLAEKAGGRATDGRMSIANMRNRRFVFTSLVLGSINDVQSFMDMLKGGSMKEKVYEKHYSDSDETSTDLD